MGDKVHFATVNDHKLPDGSSWTDAKNRDETLFPAPEANEKWGLYTGRQTSGFTGFPFPLGGVTEDQPQITVPLSTAIEWVWRLRKATINGFNMTLQESGDGGSESYEQSISMPDASYDFIGEDVYRWDDVDYVFDYHVEDSVRESEVDIVRGKGSFVLKSILAEGNNLVPGPYDWDLLVCLTCRVASVDPANNRAKCALGFSMDVYGWTGETRNILSLSDDPAEYNYYSENTGRRVILKDSNRSEYSVPIFARQYNDGDYPSIVTISSDITITPSKYWPYKNSEGQPVFDTTTGKQLNPIS